MLSYVSVSFVCAVADSDTKFGTENQIAEKLDSPVWTKYRLVSYAGGFDTDYTTCLPLYFVCPRLYDRPGSNIKTSSISEV